MRLSQEDLVNVNKILSLLTTHASVQALFRTQMDNALNAPSCALHVMDQVPLTARNTRLFFMS
jgi:hypothetical protein